MSYCVTLIYFGLLVQLAATLAVTGKRRDKDRSVEDKNWNRNSCISSISEEHSPEKLQKGSEEAATKDLGIGGFLTRFFHCLQHAAKQYGNQTKKPRTMNNVYVRRRSNSPWSMLNTDAILSGIESVLASPKTDKIVQSLARKAVAVYRAFDQD